MSCEKITISISGKIFDKIESKRGLVSRSRYIESVLENAFSKKE